jgi:hypothetical protein
MSDPVDELIALEQERCRATSARDWSSLGELLDPDFTYTHTGGDIEDREQYLAAIRTRNLRIQRTSVAVRVYGDAAVMTGEGVFTLHEMPGDAPGPPPVIQVMEQAILQTWIRREAGWRLVAFQGTMKRGSLVVAATAG